MREGRRGLRGMAGGLITRDNANKARKSEQTNCWLSGQMTGVMNLPFALSFNDLLQACLLLCKGQARLTALAVRTVNTRILLLWCLPTHPQEECDCAQRRPMWRVRLPPTSHTRPRLVFCSLSAAPQTLCVQSKLWGELHLCSCTGGGCSGGKAGRLHQSTFISKC